MEVGTLGGDERTPNVNFVPSIFVCVAIYLVPIYGGAYPKKTYTRYTSIFTHNIGSYYYEAPINSDPVYR